ncbi:hypothetical protein QQS21_007280 [Conoideocrella luteorostrata]|uniref:NACHT domain-containing protein n=1 Tax=Conoideocrella luteorostrata TaxID=1105319 RepID=A0AAJ0CQE6_9HYPO|nr:hypothetical protein QQS21_007280 [Conoideocrella luteorostrata]
MASSGSDWARRSANQTLAPEAYTVAWICAITTEYVAARQFLDEQHDGPDYQSPNDNNDYTLGKIGKHNVVLAVLPYGEYGLSNATGVAKDILHTFPKIKIGLMVGIGGGAPTPKQDIRLGDVVVGAGNGGVFQYDFGKAIQDKSFQTTGQLITPPIFLGTTISGLEADYEEGGNQIGAVINFILETRPQLQQKYKRPYNDLLYQTGVIHSESNESCEASCGSGPTKLVLRRQRAGGAENPAIHYGLIASANTVMKDAVVRDKLAAEKGVLCFEMEAAGLMKQFPCLVIRGICDYADTHKNKEWQGYAAMAAAAYATDFLHKIKPRALEAERDITRISSGIRDIRLTQEEQEKRQEIRDRKEKDYACRKALYVTDPSCDKVRIEEAKGGLLKDSYRWVLDQTDFKQFCGDRQSRMLWIKGDPGKGKTMLLCGIIDELEKSSPDTLSYFFCQATEGQYSNAVSVLRGLMYPLLIQHPSLIKHVREQFDLIGEKLFQGVNVWVYMVEIFMNMLTDPTSQDTILIVDALDECTTARYELLDFIIQSTQTPSSSVRWIISSRNWQEIETQLRDAQKAQLHLELNNDSIARAVTTYIEYKVNCLTRDKQYDENIRSAVQKHLITNAQGTFLWVALVCQQLAKPQVARRHTLAKLNSFPPGLDSLYDRMMVQIFDSEDADRCKEILAIFSVTYRPITVKELQVLIESPEELQQGDLEDIIASCGSFFTIQDGTIYFVHQSAKDYLLEKASHQILTAGIAQQHHALFTKSLKAVSGTIKRDIYRLGAPGVLIDQVSRPSPDPLASIGYSCVFWIDHFDDSKPKNSDHRDLSANNAIYSFIQKKYLYWLESLSLLRSISTGTIAIQKLANIMVS